MWRYTFKRVLLAILTIFIICFITFFTMNAIPGGPFDAEKAPAPHVQKVLEERFHLDEPLLKQFILYIENALQGDFGISLKNGREISKIILESFSISLKLGGLAMITAIIPGIILGSIAALMRNRWSDRAIIFFTTLFVAVPSFILATFFLLFFCLKLGWFPVWSLENPNYLLPILSLALYPMSYIIRLTKTSMLDVLDQDYIRTARSKGVAEWKVIFKHALRNALIPVITYIGPMTVFIITGSLVVESIFNIGGLGSKFVTGITNRDYPLIMATTIFLAFIMVVVTLVSDIIYKIIDPKIKFE